MCQYDASGLLDGDILVCTEHVPGSGSGKNTMLSNSTTKANNFVTLATSTRKLQDVCVDKEDWRDSDGDTCLVYERACTSDRAIPTPAFYEYAVNGISALEACCVCGGGSSSNLDFTQLLLSNFGVLTILSVILFITAIGCASVGFVIRQFRWHRDGQQRGGPREITMENLMEMVQQVVCCCVLIRSMKKLLCRRKQSVSTQHWNTKCPRMGSGKVTSTAYTSIIGVPAQTRPFNIGSKSRLSVPYAFLASRRMILSDRCHVDMCTMEHALISGWCFLERVPYAR